MKKVSKQLMAFYMAQAALALVVIILFAMMELITLGAAFLGLRLFKFKAIHNDLVNRKETAMWKWGKARLLILEAPMVINTLLYYIYMNPTFGYMAIILLLCLPFVFPSYDRCVSETTEE